MTDEALSPAESAFRDEALSPAESAFRDEALSSAEPAVRSEPFRFTAQVRWSDPDQMGHINHTRYLTYFEDARLAFLAEVPRPGGYIAARVAVDYLYPVAFRQGLSLEALIWVGKLGTTSLTLLGELYDGALPVARSEVVLVAYSYPDASKRMLSEGEREFLSRYVAA